jgi:CRP-like cAMP-binding protein
MLPKTHDIPKNRLLVAFPEEDRERYFSGLELVSLSLKQVLFKAGAPIEHVYFIEDGVSSILTNLSNGSTLEVGIIGMEGIIGMAVVLGDETSAQQGATSRLTVPSAKPAFYPIRPHHQNRSQKRADTVGEVGERCQGSCMRNKRLIIFQGLAAMSPHRR